MEIGYASRYASRTIERVHRQNANRTFVCSVAKHAARGGKRAGIRRIGVYNAEKRKVKRENFEYPHGCPASAMLACRYTVASRVEVRNKYDRMLHWFTIKPREKHLWTKKKNHES
ncbi:Hypothetical protein CINCED_3A010472 [Cinara cedri]|uniref:Uncharacterized protein n=1 Tax=Cinara cedri TaxID=506608 RepID=A0A5E4NRQ3_9HEMI|nr:Hypothetical protein CINCED_3A010472 [Cinara cedri]